MIKRPALGRGLSALIPTKRPEGESSAAPTDGLAEIELDLLEPNRRQPRRRFEESGLQELAQSIRESGILQPVLVTRHGERYRILAGERRVRAARLAGLTKVPVLVREGLVDRDHLLLALVENVQRRDLSPLEEAEAFQNLRDEFGMTQDEIADRVGKDRATVANTMRLMRLPPSLKTMVDDGALTAGHARALLTLSSAADQESVAKEIVAKGLSVRLTEARVEEMTKGAAKKAAKERPADADTRDAELRLQRELGTKVEIRRKKRGGEIRISFYSEPELIGLFERLMGEGK